jgi:pyruvate kinase
MEQLTAWLNAERGRRQKLAEALEIFPSALSQWNQVPATRATEVSAFTGIPLHELRPDVFPVPTKEGAAA